MKKICIVLPDGVGIKNYIYSSFFQKLKKEEYHIILIHSISKNAIKEIIKLDGNSIKFEKIPEYKETVKQKFLRELVCLLRLKNNIKLTKNDSLNENWKPNKKGKNYFFYKLIELISSIFYFNYRIILFLEKIYDNEIYKSTGKIILLLKRINPDIIFNTHQRSLIAVPIVAAAKKLGIKNIGAIYSWDNIPKARLSVRTNEYVVWSKHMKNEMKIFYPEIKQDNIIITGTPQFEFYSDKELLISKEFFFKKIGLDMNRKVVCFSGDDTRTSPFDPEYLEDLAESIMKMPENERCQILLRRCPVDISGRFQKIIKKHSTIIKEAAPIWNFDKEGDNWQLIYPNYKDIALLVNTVYHSDVVINVGSTMAHDFAIFNKPAIYLNYNPVKSNKWNIETIYKFQHFRSMKNLNPVFWLNEKKDIIEVIKKALNSDLSSDEIKDAQRWLNIISEYREIASQNIVNYLNI
jgi:hypothetical protein